MIRSGRHLGRHVVDLWIDAHGQGRRGIRDEVYPKDLGGQEGQHNR